MIEKEETRMIPKMDYIIVTYNDIDTITNAIESIRKQGNVNRLIIVASERCTDGTLDLMKQLKMNDVGIDILITENVGLAYARQIGIKEVETEWFVFVDGDVVLSNNWIDDMFGMMDKLLNVGALFGYLYRDAKHQKDLEEYAGIKEIDKRMFTHNTLIRTELVKDWIPDDKIHSYEDYLLTQHIIKKGYKVFNVPVFGLHDHCGSLWKESVWGGAGTKLSGYHKSIFGPFKDMVGSIYGGLKRTLRQRTFKFLKNGIITGFGAFWGYLRADKYRKKSG